MHNPECADVPGDPREDCPTMPDDLAPLWDAALPADAPGAWIRAAIDRLRDA